MDAAARAILDLEFKQSDKDRMRQLLAKALTTSSPNITWVRLRQLKINLEHRIDLRQGLIYEGVFPPP